MSRVSVQFNVHRPVLIQFVVDVVRFGAATMGIVLEMPLQDIVIREIERSTAVRTATVIHVTGNAHVIRQALIVSLRGIQPIVQGIKGSAQLAIRGMCIAIGAYPAIRVFVVGHELYHRRRYATGVAIAYFGV